MNYENIQNKIQYWIKYDGRGDEYRKKNDRDCQLTNGNLFADTLFSLWLPLRYTLDYCNSTGWNDIKLEAGKSKIKDNNDYLLEICNNIREFLPSNNVTKKLEKLFEIGDTRANVIILPYRKWNNRRGGAPYFDYMPHFLFDLLNTEDECFLEVVRDWIDRQHLKMFFEVMGKSIKDIDFEDILKENIKDLVGTDKPTSHIVDKNNIELMLSNYISIIENRAEYYKVE